MTSPIKALVVMEDGVDPAMLQASMPPETALQLVGLVEGIEDSWSVIQETPAELLVIACNGYSDKALFLIDGAVKQQPERPVVVLYTGSPNGFVRRVFEAGADDIVSIPESGDRIQFAIEKALARRQGSQAGTVATAPMICVLGPKGGTGKTLTSCNLAVALAAKGQRVAIVDLDLQFGDVSLALGLAPDRTIFDLAKSGGSLDVEKIEYAPGDAFVLISARAPESLRQALAAIPRRQLSRLSERTNSAVEPRATCSRPAFRRCSNSTWRASSGSSRQASSKASASASPNLPATYCSISCCWFIAPG